MKTEEVSGHTPGPILITKCGCGHPACNQHTLSTQGTVGFEIADAMLYAAAPELLEAWIEWFAATETLAELERQSDTTKRFDAALYAQEAAENKARAAIAKARGGAS